jgi:hypothetical protein
MRIAHKPQVLVSGGSGGSMNGSVCRGMMGVPGLAVLGMTAALAGAKAVGVKERPPLYRYVSN